MNATQLAASCHIHTEMNMVENTVFVEEVEIEM